MSDRLDEIFNTLEMLVNGSNPTNYIMGDEPKMKQRYDAFIEAKQALQSYIDSKIIEARLDELQKLNDWTINGMKTVDDICMHLDQKIYVLDGRIKALNHRKDD